MSNDHHPHLNRRAFLLASGATLLLPLGAPLSSAFAQSSTSAPMKIGVVGSGRIGGTIGGLWTKAGHKVMLSSRHPEALKSIADGLGPNASTGTVEQAIAFGDVILVAVPYAALPQLGADNAAGLKGKVVLDACNPISSRDGDMVKEANEIGVGAASAKYFAGARLVRAFNSFSWMTFSNESNRAGEKIGVPIASDDAGALVIAEKLVRDAGFEPVAVPLARAKEFAPPGGPLFTKALPVSELKQQLGIK
jgi:8-hydroxy-5-deazaflavin:NADPH oxidoreductase